MNYNEIDLVYGIHPINEIILAKKRKIKQVWVQNPIPQGVKSLIHNLPKYVIIKEVSRETITKMVQNQEHQGIVAQVSNLLYKKNFFDPLTHPMIILCDGIEDPRNLGAILRSAYCTNFMGIILPNKGTASISGSSIKASAGLIEYLDLFKCSSSIEGAQLAKKAGYNLYMAALGGIDIKEIEFKKPLCLVIGNEGLGIQKSILNMGKSFFLPQKRPDISYNASVACGISMFYIQNLTKS